MSGSAPGQFASRLARNRERPGPDYYVNIWHDYASLRDWLNNSWNGYRDVHGAFGSAHELLRR